MPIFVNCIIKMNKTKQIKKGAAKESPTKILKNSLRERKRYLLIKIIPFSRDLPDYNLLNNTLKSAKIHDSLSRAIIHTAKLLLGIISSSRAGTRIMKNLSNKGYIVIRCNRTYVDYIKSSLSLITEISLPGLKNPLKIIAEPILVSGSLHKIKERLG